MQDKTFAKGFCFAKIFIFFLIGWGIGKTVLMKLLYPMLSGYIEKIPYRIAQPICIGVLIFITADMILTYSAFGRMALRNEGIKPYTWVGEWMDTLYDNDYMYDKFPVMRPGS